MGKGDKKTKKGKRSMGSYGVSRKRSAVAAIATKPKAKKKAAPKAKEVEKKAPAKTTTVKKTDTK